MLTGAWTGTVIYYETAGRLWLALDQTWDVNTNGPENCQTTRCREFRYDSGRARYLVRERDPSPGPGFLEPRNDAVWTDYVGDVPYAERFIDRDSGATQDRASFVPGIAQRDESSQPPAEQPLYFHGDQIGTSRVLTDGDGNVAARIVYTAFGEPVFADPPSDSATRYLYAGAWGYENFNDPAFPFLHVGERWYDPATGRFLQRDPIGVVGGLNTYAYVQNRPTNNVDPQGLLTPPPYGGVPPPPGMVPRLCCRRDIDYLDAFSIAHFLVPYLATNRCPARLGIVIPCVFQFELAEPILREIDESLYYETRENIRGDIFVGVLGALLGVVYFVGGMSRRQRNHDSRRPTSGQDYGRSTSSS